MDMIKELDRRMSAEPVIKTLEEHIERLKSFEIEIEDLVIEKKVSKSLQDYSVENRSVSALKRAKHHGIDVKPGQRVNFVVRNDNADSMDRTRLDFEAQKADYDQEFYKTNLIRAAESILSPLGLDREDIRRRLGNKKQSRIALK
jgi:DNA polymerase I